MMGVGGKARGIRKTKACKQKVQQRAHERKLAAKWARRNSEKALEAKHEGS